MEKKSAISFLEVESIPLLIKDFLTQKILGFEQDIYTEGNIKNRIAQKKNSFTVENRQILVEVLSEQHSKLALSEKQKNNLDLLQREDTFTVTTGHQLNLFSGPAFFIYKILQTIKLADHLNGIFPVNKIVPVFWMASEDHDFEEINHFKTESNYYETKAHAGGAVGEIIVEDDAFISQFAQEFKDSVFGTELILMMKRAYKKDNTLSEATRILVHELFSDYGLIIIDGDHPRLKSQLKEVFKAELLHQNLFKKTKETVKFLTEKYGKVQVNPREINLFYLTETRDRIAFDGEKFIIVDKNISFTKDEILHELENHPEKFSPNALMRPVYQESILPNLAYIGGNAEIMYWLELKNYFKNISLPFPVLIPRNSMLFVKEKSVTKIEKLNLKLEDFILNFSEVTSNLLMQNNTILALLNEQETMLQKQFDEIALISSDTDKSFGTLVEAEKTRQLKSFKRMKKRLLRAEKIKQSEKLQRLENLFLTIHPGGNWQERVLNFSVFYADHGREWLQTCYDEINVDRPELVIVSI